MWVAGSRTAGPAAGLLLALAVCSPAQAQMSCAQLRTVIQKTREGGPGSPFWGDLKVYEKNYQARCGGEAGGSQGGAGAGGTSPQGGGSVVEVPRPRDPTRRTPADLCTTTDPHGVPCVSCRSHDKVTPPSMAGDPSYREQELRCDNVCIQAVTVRVCYEDGRCTKADVPGQTSNHLRAKMTSWTPRWMTTFNVDCPGG